MARMIHSEAVRIATNYIRLFASFAIGLYLVRLLVGFGSEVFGVYILITVGFGFGIMLKELLRIALVPMLGKQLKDGKPDGEAFDEIYAASFILSISVSLAGAFLLAVFSYFLLPTDLPESLRNAAIIFIGFRIVQVILTVSLAPLLNLLIITRRHTLSNLLLLGERMAELMSLLVPIFLLNGVTKTDALIWLGAGTTMFLIVIYLAFGLYIIGLERRFKPTIGLARRRAVISAVKEAGWSGLIVLSTNLYIRLDIILISSILGPLATTLFGLSIQMMGYLRQLTAGLVTGLDSIFASFLRGSNPQNLSRALLIQGSTELQASLIFSAVAFFQMFMPDVLQFWIGDVLENPAQNIPLLADITILLIIGISVRGLTEGWMAMMTGSGKISRFAGWMLPAAIFNPVIILALWWVLGDAFGIIHVAWVFLILQIVVYGIGMPILTSRALIIPLKKLVWPLFPPLMITAVIFGLGAVVLNLIPDFGLFYRLLFGMVLAGVCIVVNAVSLVVRIKGELTN